MNQKSSNSVDLIPIDSKTRTIQTCFRQCLYDVPNFQRPYSWSQEQLDDFWEDVALAQGDFFFGSTVTWVSQKRDLFNDTYSIIDGQQRLTTCTIALSVIRDSLESIANQEGVPKELIDAAESQAATTQRYLISIDDDGTEYAAITRPEPMFYDHIQKPSAIPSGVTWNKSAEKIGIARQFFEVRIQEHTTKLAADQAIEALKQIRSNILKARVIQVELTSEEDGFLIFETLNTRGADLKLADLVKNLLIRGGAQSSKDRENIARRWDQLIELVQDGRTNPDVDDYFIWQSWNSRRTARKQPELFKAISRLLGSDPECHISYLTELESDAGIYKELEFEEVSLQKDRSGSNAFAIPEFVDSVRALATFDISVANSTIIAIARKYSETNLVKRSQVIEVISMVENFHFQFNALTSSGSTGGTSARYNRFAVRIETASTRKEVSEAISDLKSKLQASLPNESSTKGAFEKLFYAPKLRLRESQKPRARKSFIAYTLMKFMKDSQLVPAGTDPSHWSVEHIRPQSSAVDSTADPAFSIGNLVLISPRMNGDLGNSEYASKETTLRSSPVYFDKCLDSWSASVTGTPTDDQIRERASKLAEEALDRVWKI